MSQRFDKTVRVTYTKISPALCVDDVRRLTDLLPDGLDVALRFTQLADRARYILGRLLLADVLRQFGQDARWVYSLQYDDHGKPHLPDEIAVSFNISHSGVYVVCASARRNVRLGIDIEEVKPVNFDEVVTSMDATQWKYIMSSANPLVEFYRLWTAKESVLKAEGTGLSVPPDQVAVAGGLGRVKHGKEWFLYPLALDPRYFAHLASEVECEVVVQQKCF